MLTPDILHHPTDTSHIFARFRPHLYPFQTRRPVLPASMTALGAGD
jgi:hypothetical protein